MDKKLSRKDFLKLASLLPFSYYLPRFIPAQNSNKPNILVVVFDSWSASNTSLYGYPRETTPNINHLAEKAIVYHNHYASDHYTYPSTASFLTGVLAWDHKGYWDNQREKILDEYVSKTLFNYLPEYNRSAYTHNTLGNGLLALLTSGIDRYYPTSTLSFRSNHWYESIFKNDADISNVSWIRVFENLERGHSNSLFLSRLFTQIKKEKYARYQTQFPRGIPAINDSDNFVIETAMDWTAENLVNTDPPFFSYLHLLPPHAPYRTRVDFVDHFKNDGYLPVQKPRHPLGQSDFPYEVQTELRREYDEFLMYADAEFQRLMDLLSQRGLLGNTIVILTSDHGELFERNIPEHLIPSFHQPLMHIPLLIFMPDQKERIDIHSLTTTIDLMPTLLHLADNPLPSWLEGELLPPFNTADRSDRTIFSVDFRRSPKTGPVTDGSIMVRSNHHKFTYLFGNQRHYSKLPESFLFELYDLTNDPEELNNLFDPTDPLSQSMLAIMEDKIREKNLELVRYT